MKTIKVERVTANNDHYLLFYSPSSLTKLTIKIILEWKQKQTPLTPATETFVCLVDGTIIEGIIFENIIIALQTAESALLTSAILWRTNKQINKLYNT